MEQEYQGAFCLVTLNVTTARIKVCFTLLQYIATVEMYAIESTKNKLILEISPGLHTCKEMKSELSNKFDLFPPPHLKMLLSL